MENFIHFSVNGGICGVYLLLHRGEVVYAGKTTNFFARSAEHWNNLQRQRRGKLPRLNGPNPINVIVFDEVRFKRCLKTDLDKEELILIQQYLPRYNTYHNRPVNPVEANIRALPCIQALIKKAGQREEEITAAIRRRRIV